jgi:hypothetical protein
MAADFLHDAVVEEVAELGHARSDGDLRASPQQIGRVERPIGVVGLPIASLVETCVERVRKAVPITPEIGRRARPRRRGACSP